MRGDDGDASDLLFLVDVPSGKLSQPLAEIAYDLMGYSKQQVTVSYHITDRPYADHELTEMLIATICGVANSYSGDGTSNFSHRYSEMTGYLWTDETLQVGGHDLLAELSNYLSKWCHLKLVIHG